VGQLGEARLDHRSFALSTGGFPLLGGRPRTVLGGLVACCGPVRRPGLGAFQRPGPSWSSGFPWCKHCRWFGPGPRPGWPGRILRSGQVPVGAAPGPVALPASADHQRSCMVTGELFVMLPEGCEPVLRTPPGRVCRIDGNDAEARVSGHLHQAVTELRRGNTSDQVTAVRSGLRLRGSGGPAAASRHHGSPTPFVVDPLLCPCYAGR